MTVGNFKNFKRVFLENLKIADSRLWLSGTHIYILIPHIIPHSQNSNEFAYSVESYCVLVFNTEKLKIAY